MFHYCSGDACVNTSYWKLNFCLLLNKTSFEIYHLCVFTFRKRYHISPFNIFFLYWCNFLIHISSSSSSLGISWKILNISYDNTYQNVAIQLYWLFVTRTWAVQQTLSMNLNWIFLAFVSLCQLYKRPKTNMIQFRPMLRIHNTVPVCYVMYYNLLCWINEFCYIWLGQSLVP